MRNTKNARKETRGIMGKNKRKTFNQLEYDHTCARSKKHKEIHSPNPTKDDTSGGSLSLTGGLESTRDLPVKGS